MGTLQLLLLTTGLSLISALTAEKPLMIPASSQELLGAWYVIRWAGDLPLPVRSKAEPMPPFILTRYKTTKIELWTTIMRRRKCTVFEMVLEDFIIPGALYSSQGYFITTYLLEATDHAVAFFKGMTGYHYYEMMVLLGRSLDENPDALRTFDEYVQWRGLDQTEIINPPDAGLCWVPSNI